MSAIAIIQVNEAVEAVAKLTKDIRTAARTIKDNEARYLVKAYYTVQENRKGAENQIRSLDAAMEPHFVLDHFLIQYQTVERSIKRILDIYTDNHPIGEWMKEIPGIGPVLAAGLLAHIDIHRAPTVGHIYSYAGLVPGQVWGKGQKRPWNAELKRICWLIGESFVKVSNREEDIYGKYYKQRKQQESALNEAGAFTEQAQAILESRNIGKDTDAYKWYSEGKLPPAHIHARAKRYAVKLFLSHLHEVWYEHTYGIKPPQPYAIAHLDHAHKIDPPELM
jgi:hypothetical protein